MRLKPWNCKHLRSEMQYHLGQCTTESEISMCKATFRMELKAMAGKALESGRKLTPGEMSILNEQGITI